METVSTSCTECGTVMPPDQGLCPKCHHPRWYTLKKVSICLLIVVTLAVVIRYVVMSGTRALSMWFG